MNAPIRFKGGDQVRVKTSARGPAGHFRKCAGREGVVESAHTDGCLVRFSSKRGDCAIVPHSDLEAAT